MLKRGSINLSKKLYILTIGGGIAFWAANFAISLTHIAADYRAALSISYLPMIAASLVGGLIIAYCVSYSLFRFYDKIPTGSSVLKSVILSFVALFMIEAFTVLVNLSHLSVYILIGAGMNVPRFLALGIVIGDQYDHLKGSA